MSNDRSNDRMMWIIKSVLCACIFVCEKEFVCVHTKYTMPVLWAHGTRTTNPCITAVVMMVMMMMRVPRNDNATAVCCSDVGNACFDIFLSIKSVISYRLNTDDDEVCGVYAV